MYSLRRALCLLLPAIVICIACASPQSRFTPAHLDPTRHIRRPVLFSSFHHPLPEEYIWTRSDSTGGARSSKSPAPRGADASAALHAFRAHFRLNSVPKSATLYIAGPRSASVWINGAVAGKFVADPLSPLGMHVFESSVAPLLHRGDNLIAIQALRGRRLPGSMNSARGMQQLEGKVMVVKIVPRQPWVDAPAILISGPQWKATINPRGSWQSVTYQDASWPAVDALSPIEGSINFFQWNADAGLYDWPGYEGAAPYLARTFLPPVRLRNVYPGRGEFRNLPALTLGPQTDPDREFRLSTSPSQPSQEYVPALTLDFGREVAGRVELISDTDRPVTVSIQYGESPGETDFGPYLGVNVLHLPPHGSGRGPKSAFRYARIRFLSGGPLIRFRAIRLEDIYYPVHYQGSFESSDPLLNRIWQVGAYTVHLCMQDDIWDAPKRDRARWMGDTDVSGRVSDTVFGDDFLLQDTLTRLIGPAPVQRHVNGIPGYSAFWLTEMANHDLHSGNTAYVASMHKRILQLLQLMDREFTAQDQFTNRTHAWLFVDWAPGLFGESPAAREGTAMEYVRAYRAGAWLLRQTGDIPNADHFAARARAIAASLRELDWANGAFGPRLQINAMAVLAGVARPGEYPSIWSHVLSQTGKPTFRPDIVTPYYGAYVLNAMAKMNHRRAALRWMREYWGGMLAEGATTFWEAYDPSWPKDHPHLDLQADGRSGYFVSMAHGWSAGPTYWLTEQILGIQPTSPGFSTVTIRPDLAGLAWARGSEPTPHGLLSVDLRRDPAMDAVVVLPAEVKATVLMPVPAGTRTVLVNGKAQPGNLTDNNTRLAIQLSGAGRYDLRPE